MKPQHIGVAIAGLVILTLLAVPLPRSADAQSSPPGGVSATNEDPIEPSSGFDEDTAEGTGYVGETKLQITHVPGGCVDQGGVVSTGVFDVKVITATLSDYAQACADYGQTVIVRDVAVVFGTNDSDVLDATRIPTGMHALAFGFAGDDVITPSDGSFDNYILAGTGVDTVLAPAQDGTYGEFVFGGEGDDALTGSAGPDVLIGGPGGDTVTGVGGSDMLHGSDGDDTLNACPADRGADTLFGGLGADRYDAPFLAGIIMAEIFDYADGERVFDCDANFVAP